MRQNLLSFIAISFFTVCSLNLHAETFVWAKTGNSDINYSYGTSVCRDSHGNVIVTGAFSGPALTFGSTTLTSNLSSGYEMFIVKYDPNGNVLWAHNAIGASGGCGVVCDANDNIYLEGVTQEDTVGIGAYQIIGTGYGVFIAKYTSAGAVSWLTAYGNGGLSAANGNCIALDASNNVYFSGTFEGSQFIIGGTTLTSTAAITGFVAKLNSSGTPQWANSIGTSGSYNYANGLGVDASGNCYISGTFEATSATFGSVTLNNPNGVCIYVAKYNSSGAGVWATGVSVALNCSVTGMCTDASGNCTIAGTYIGGSVTFGSTTLSYSGFNPEGFFVHYNSSGSVQWAQSLGSGNEIQALCADANSDIFVTGGYGSSLTLGSNVLPNGGGLFVGEFNSGGTNQWGLGVTSGGLGAVGFGVCPDTAGHCVLTGYFTTGPAVFGSTTLTNTGSNVLTAETGPCGAGNATLAPVSDLCTYSTPVTPTGGLPAGGTYSINGTTVTTLNPATLGLGNHTLTYTYNGGGCIETASQVFTVNQPPTVSFTGLASLYHTSDQPVQLTGTPSGGVFNGAGVSGSTFSPATAGAGSFGIGYAASVNGCINVEAQCVTVETGTGIINGNTGNASYSISPNPSNGTFLINMNSSNNLGNISIEVYGVTGQLIQNQALNNVGNYMNQEMNLNVAAGIYTVRINTGAGVVSEKVVVQ